MIDSIKIKGFATYQGDGISIENLTKVNFIYGSNGTGKTTITNYLYNPTDTSYLNCCLTWKNDTVLKSLVYNKGFRKRNFANGNIDGVFTLGQATNDQIAAIEKKVEKLNLLKEKGKQSRTSLEKVITDKGTRDEDFKEEAWTEIFKKHEIDFKEAFKGAQHKESFKSKLVSEFSNNGAVLLDVKVLKEKAKIIFGEAPVNTPSLTTINFNRVVEIEKDPVWQTKIIGKTDIDIAALIQKLNLNDWVNQGREFIQENDTCPFCQQTTITSDFKKNLDSYFDASFVTNTSLVSTSSSEYILLTQNIENILNQIEQTEKENKTTKLDINTFSAYLKTLVSQIGSNKELLNNKIKEPSRSITLISLKDQLENIEALISDANSQIAIHNQIVANFAIERNSLIQSIWKYLVEENKIRIQNYLRAVNGFEKGIDKLSKNVDKQITAYKALDLEIKNLNKNVTSVQPSVDQINKTLKSYGFENFEIVPSKVEKNKYQIHREDGTLAESTLSEGEVTFITFLYFLQLAKGSTSEEHITEDRILIIDDPISSLDSNILFLISSLLKEIIKQVKKGVGNIKQLIILTHNVYFHKEVSFIDGRTKDCSDTSYWILRKGNKVTGLQTFKMKNPIKNSYELLWSELKNKDHNSGITIQNTMRRILENYFRMLGKSGNDDLIKKFTNAQDQEICRSLICWINDGSHSIPDDLYIEHLGDITDKYFEVFKSIFTQTGHEEHYKMMIDDSTLEPTE